MKRVERLALLIVLTLGLTVQFNADSDDPNGLYGTNFFGGTTQCPLGCVIGIPISYPSTAFTYQGNSPNVANSPLAPYTWGILDASDEDIVTVWAPSYSYDPMGPSVAFDASAGEAFAAWQEAESPNPQHWRELSNDRIVPVTPVPEPGTMALLVIGGTVILFRVGAKRFRAA